MAATSREYDRKVFVFQLVPPFTLLVPFCFCPGKKCRCGKLEMSLN